MKKLLLLLLFIASDLFAQGTITRPVIYSTGSALTIQTGITVTGQSGSIWNFTGSTVSGLPQSGVVGLETALNSKLNAADAFTNAAANILYQPKDTDLTSFAGITPTTFSLDFLVSTDALDARNKLGFIGGILSTDFGGTGTATPGMVAGANITITGIYPNQIITGSAGGGTTDGDKGDITITSGVWNIDQDALSFAELASKPTTIAGYGIIDAQPLDADLTAVAAIVTTPFGLGLLDDNTAADARVTLELGSAALSASTAFEPALGNPAANGYVLTSTTTGVRSWAIGPSGGTGTVTSFAFTDGAGITGTVLNSSSTPTLSLTLGAISPTTVNASGNIVSAGNMSALNLSGTNTGDQVIPPTTVAVANKFFNAYTITGITGAFTATQPAFSDLSGSAVIAQLPTGQTSTTVAIGNDSRFPSSMTGMRKGAGIGSLDVAGIPNIDFALNTEGTIAAGTTSLPTAWPIGKIVVKEATALTVTSFATLRPANEFSPGTIVTYIDHVTTESFGRVFRRTGGDTLNGATADVAPFIAGGLEGRIKTQRFETDGISSWRMLDTGMSVDRFQDPLVAAKQVIVDTSLQSTTTTGTFTLAGGASVSIKPETIPAGLSQPFVIGVNEEGELIEATIIAEDLPQQYLSAMLPTEVDAVNNVAITAPTDTVRIVTAPVGTALIPWPSASSYGKGQSIRVYDVTGVLNSTNRFQLQASGTDTIDGSSTFDIAKSYINQLFTVSQTTGQWVSSKTSTSEGGGLSIQQFQTVPNNAGAATWGWDSTKIQQNGNLQLVNNANTLSIPAPISGGPFELNVTQPSSGAAGTLALPTGSRTAANGLGVIRLSTANNAKDKLRGSFDGTYFWWDAVLDYTGTSTLSASPDKLWWKLNDAVFQAATSTYTTTGDAAGLGGSTTTAATLNAPGTPGTAGANSPFSYNMQSGRTMISTSGLLPAATSIVSASFWIYDTVWNASTGVHTVLGITTAIGTAKTFRVVQVGDGTTGVLRAELVGSTGGQGRWESLTTTGVNSVMSTSTWHHVAIIFDNSNTGGLTPNGEITIYLNGAPQGTTTTGSTSGATPATFANNNFQIGSSSISCSLDDVRIYGRRLEPGEIATLALTSSAQ